LDIIIFVLRTVFLVLIYVFIFIILTYIVRDLRRTGGEGNSAADPAVREVESRTGPGRGVTMQVESAPAEYRLNGMEYEIGGETRLGRSPDSEIVLPGPFASNHHARLYRKNGQYWLEDLGSRNGTYLNGFLLNGPAVLANGDKIGIGDITLRFVRWGYEVESGHRMRSGTFEE